MASWRLLPLLCAVLLAVLGVTLASAAAPVYGPGEVTITVAPAPDSTTRSAQLMGCSLLGAVLVPDVSNAVHSAIFTELTSQGVGASYGYMGGSSLLSPSDCTTSAATLSCIWNWDQGRYTAVADALPFYKGNRSPSALSGAEMLSTTVGNFWRLDGTTQAYPGTAMQRYGVIVRKAGESPNWADSSPTAWSYGTVQSTSYYLFCAVERSSRVDGVREAAMLANLFESSGGRSEEGPITWTSKAPESDGMSEKVMTELIGICLLGAVVVGLIVALILCKARDDGCCCFSEPKWVRESAASSSGSLSGASRGGLAGGAGRLKRAHTSAIVSSGSMASIDDNRSFHAPNPTGARGRRRSLVSSDAASRHAEDVFSDDVLADGWHATAAPSGQSVVSASPPLAGPAASLPRTQSRLHSPQDASLMRTSSWNLYDDTEGDTASGVSPRVRLRRNPSVSFVG